MPTSKARMPDQAGIVIMKMASDRHRPQADSAHAIYLARTQRTGTMETTALPAENSQAPIKSRILASLIDLSIGVLALLLAKLTLSQSFGNALSILGVFVSVAIVLGVIIYQAVSLSSTGQTVGKRMMKLRVVNFSDASNPGFVKAVVIRWWLPSLIYPIPYLGWAFWFADVLFLFKKDRRCLHDLMAGTKVVQLATDDYPSMSA